MLVRGLLHRVVVRGLPEQVHGDDGARCQTCGARDLDGLVKPRRVEVERPLVAVHEDRNSASEDDGLGRRGEGEARDQDGVRRPETEAAQRQDDGVGAVGARHGRAHAAVAGQLRLELAHLRPHDELPMLENPSDGLPHAWLQPPLLRLEVDELHRCRPVRRGGHRAASTRRPASSSP